MVYLLGIRLTPLPIAIAATLLILLLEPALQVSAQSGFEYIPLSEELTNVYGMLGYSLPEDLRVYTAYYVESKGILVAAGNGYIAGIAVSPETKPAIVWRQSLIGTASTVSAASYDSSWVAVGSDVGEIVLVNLDDPSIRADFYTASRDIVMTLALNPAVERPIVAALDDQGFIYVFSVGESGWIEIGPVAHDGALKSFTSGAPLLILTQELLFEGPGYKGLPLAAAILGGAASNSDQLLQIAGSLTVDVTAYIYYETEVGVILPATTKTITLEDGTVIKKTLYYAVAPPSGAKYTWPPGGATTLEDGATLMLSVNPSEAENLVSFKYLPGPARLVSLYTEEVYDGTTGQLASFTCYYAEAEFQGRPGSTVDLGNVVARLVSSTSLEDCVNKVNLKVTHDFVYFQPIILVDLNYPPSSFDFLKSAYMILLPVVGATNATGISDTTAISVFRVPENSPLAENGVSRILVAGDTIGGSNVALVYLLDDNWGLVDIEHNPLIYYLGSTLTTIAVSNSATAIYLGTDDGHIYRLLWDGTKYYAANALVVDVEGSITSIREIEAGSYIITSTSNGIVQLVNLEDWKPMWRGLPGFNGVDTGINDLALQGSTLNLLTGFSLTGVEGEASNKIYVFTPRGTDLNPIIVNAKILIQRLDGSVVEPEIPQGSYVALLNASGKPLAKATFDNGKALLYAPTGFYNLFLSLEGYGQAVAPLDVAPPLTSKSYEFRFVEATFTVYTPSEPPFPEAAIAYTLLAGPKEGASLEFHVIEYYGDMEYRPIASSFEVVTGSDGSALALLWSDTVYSVTARLDGYYDASITFDSGLSNEASIEVHPVLYRIDVKALDSEVYRLLSQEFPVRNAVLVISLGERSAKLQMPNGAAEIYLSKASYMFTLSAPAYETLVQQVTITGSTNITLLAEPLRITVPITIVLVDEVIGVANGPLPQTTVKVELVDPPLEYEFEGVTDREGRLLVQGVRPGIYRITVSDPVIGTVTVDDIAIMSPEEIRVKVEPIYVNVTFNLVDADLLVPAAGSFIATLVYERIEGASTSVELESSVTALKLPKGIYTIIISSREGYYNDYVLAGEVISDNAEITAPLTPLKLPVTIAVVYSDDETGLASGGVAGALVEISIVEPELPYAKIVGITGSDGTITLILRAGVYEVKVSSPLTESASTRISVAAGGNQQASFIVSVKPLYATVNVNLVDREVIKQIPTALLKITWNGPTTTSEKLVTVIDGVARVKVPIGSLTFTGILEGYYRQTSIALNLTVPGETSITILMEPLIINVNISVLYEQQIVEVAGSAITLPRAPVPDVKVTVEPDDDLLRYLGIPSTTLTMGETGTLTAPLRGGKYKIIVEGAHIEPSEATAIVNEENRSIRITVKPVLYNVVLKVVDPELREDVGSPESVVLSILSFNGVNINTEILSGPVIEAKLPAGTYRILVTSTGYAESIQDLMITGDAIETLTLRPITRSILFTVLAETVLGTSNMVSGKLILEAVNIPLKNPVIEVDVKQGQAVAELRLGEYRIYYKVPEADYTIPVDTLVVQPGEDQLQISLTVKAPKVNLALALIDAELGTPVNDAAINLVYVGPLGQYSQVIEDVDGSVQVELPPGTVVVDVEAPGYQIKRQEIILKPDRVDASVKLNPLLYNAQLRLVDQDGMPIEEEVIIRFIHTELPYTKEVRGKGSTIQVNKIRPGIYRVIITPVGSERLDETEARVSIEPPGVANPDTIQVNFKAFKVTLTLVDASTGGTVPFPYRALIERVATGAPSPLEVVREITIQGSAQVTLPYGDYTVTLQPEGPDYYVVDEPFNVTVDKDGEIQIKLQPRIYVITVVVTDDNNRPLANSFVSVSDAEGNEIQSGYTDNNGFFVFRAVFGTYKVTVSHPGFHTAERIISVPQNTNITVSLEPGLRVLLLRYGPLVTGFASLAIIAVLIYRMRSALSERLLKEEEYF